MSPPVEKVENNVKPIDKVDVAVIGAGIIGVSTAYYLAKAGVSVAVLEKGVVGGEQSSRNWGWVRQQNRDEREIPLMKRSTALWGGLREEIGTDLGFRRNGLLYVTRDAKELATWEQWVNLAAQYQVHSRMVSTEEIKSLAPALAKPWLGGVSSPSDGHAEPALAAPAIAKAAQALGASIHQGCAVRGLDVQGGRIAGVITETGRFAAQSVVCAGGAWTSMLCRKYGIDFPQAGVRSTAFSTTPAAEVTKGGFSTPAFTMRRRMDGGYTIALRGRGNVEITPQGIRYERQFWPTYKARRSEGLKIRMGASFFYGPEALASWKDDSVSPFEKIRVLDPAPQRDLVDHALEALVEAYPSLAGIKAAQSWGGWIDSTPDAIPVISAINQVPGLYIASGFSGHGFGIGPGAGHLAADLVMGRTPIVDPRPFEFERFEKKTFGPVARM